jgi:hypothetical protein
MPRELKARSETAEMNPGSSRATVVRPLVLSARFFREDIASMKNALDDLSFDAFNCGTRACVVARLHDVTDEIISTVFYQFVPHTRMTTANLHYNTRFLNLKQTVGSIMGSLA